MDYYDFACIVEWLKAFVIAMAFVVKSKGFPHLTDHICEGGYKGWMQPYREVALQVMVIIRNVVFLCPRVLLFGKSRIIFTVLYGVSENPAHSFEAINLDDFSCTLLVQSVR